VKESDELLTAKSRIGAPVVLADAAAKKVAIVIAIRQL